MTSFDRVRPRSAAAPPVTGAPAAVDAEGKRALFSSASDVVLPGVGSALVECSRCDQRTVLGPLRALRAALPSVHLGVRVGHGEDVVAVGLPREYPTYMRCPACNRPSWVRFTWQL